MTTIDIIALTDLACVDAAYLGVLADALDDAGRGEAAGRVRALADPARLADAVCRLRTKKGRDWSQACPFCTLDAQDILCGRGEAWPGSVGAYRQLVCDAVGGVNDAGDATNDRVGPPPAAT